MAESYHIAVQAAPVVSSTVVNLIWVLAYIWSIRIDTLLAGQSGVKRGRALAIQRSWLSGTAHADDAGLGRHLGSLVERGMTVHLRAMQLIVVRHDQSFWAVSAY